MFRARVTEYACELAGRPTEVRQYAAAVTAQVFTAANTTTYTADSINQYTAIVSQITNSQISDTPAYDANGKTTTVPSCLVLEYDEENRLVSAATLTAREEYTYDGLGRRVERRTFTAASGLTAPATTTRYVYDGWRAVLCLLPSVFSLPPTAHRHPSSVLRLPPCRSHFSIYDLANPNEAGARLPRQKCKNPRIACRYPATRSAPKIRPCPNPGPFRKRKNRITAPNLLTC